MEIMVVSIGWDELRIWAPFVKYYLVHFKHDVAMI